MKPESRRSSFSPYSLPTIVEMLGLNRPLPMMIVARPSSNTSLFGMATMNRPAAMITAPVRMERW
ncbi:hypothetical protein D3C71_1657900 [compost metagenome]